MQRGVSNKNKIRKVSYYLVPLVLSMLGVIVSIVFISYHSAYRNAILKVDREKTQIARILDFEAKNFLMNLSRDEGLIDIFQAQADPQIGDKHLAAFNRRHETEYVAIINRNDGRVIADTGNVDTMPSNEILLRKFIEVSSMRGMDGINIGVGKDSIITHNGRSAIILVVLPISQDIAIVVFRQLDVADWRRLSIFLNIPSLRVQAEAPANMVSYPIQGITPSIPQLALVWQDKTDETDILNDIALYGGIAALLIAFVAFFVFRNMKTSTEAILRSEAVANHEARHDALSGLPNRAVFCEAVETKIAELINKGGMAAVLLLDLDKFKEINDTYGHAAGDKVLVDFGERVRNLLRQTDVIARLGGDEFAVLHACNSDLKEVNRLAQSIVDAANAPFEMDGLDMQIGVTIGIAIIPQDGVDIATILRAADTALYRAKNEGRNRFSLYEQRMTEAERVRKLVDDELRSAIDKDELTLFYQPQVYAETGMLASVEALVRWRHPIHGMISPAMFVPAAEERGLIVPLGEWVMRRACRDAARWPNLRVGVNVSATQFRQNNFVQTVERILFETGIKPVQIELELTEGVLVESADQAEAAMVELRDMGVKLALDDFGTGYSSLIYLRRFAFDKIKIDKSFLESMETNGEGAILVHSVVHLGRALGLEVTAEGVETEEQSNFLRSIGCHYLQGYLFSKPVPADRIDDLLRKQYQVPLQASAG